MGGTARPAGGGPVTAPGVVASVALVLASIALASGGQAAGPRRRVATAITPAEPPARPDRLCAVRRPGTARMVAALAGLAVAVLVGGWAGAVLGVLVAVGLDRGLVRLEPRATRQEREAVTAALPFAADLLAAVLRAGAPTPLAVTHVAAAVGGPLGDRLGRVARSLELGAPAAEAWQVLDGVPAAASLVRAAVRANESGAALAGACARLGAELRAGNDAAAEAAANRAGVLVVLPLGCCFLPAFVLLGVVPIVLGVLDGAL
jgi:pilus assembly protein TadC